MGSRFYQRKSSHFNGAHLSDAAQHLIDQFEHLFSDSKKDVLKNSKEIGNVISHYFKKHPYAMVSSTLLAGGVISYLLSKSLSANDPSYRLYHRRSSKARQDVSGLFDQMLTNIMDDLKTHSTEICDTIIDNYVKKRPLQATGAALAASLILNLLSRR